MTPDMPVEKAFRLVPQQRDALRKLGIANLRDLLYHFPARHGDTADIRAIAGVTAGEAVTLYGKIERLETGKGFVKKIAMATATLSDDTGSIDIVWFNQPYIAKMIPEGALVRVEGKVTERKGKPYLSNPKIEKVGTAPIAVGASLFGSGGESHHLYPVYPESRGITSNWFFHSIQKVFRSGMHETLIDPIPQEILAKYNLPSLKTALIWMHAPQSQRDADTARKRFSFEEIFIIQLHKQQERLAYEKRNAFVIEKTEEDIKKFTSRFPFEATDAQKNAITDCLANFASGHPMSRLLEGDVGSGKTAVAATLAYATVTTRPRNQDYGRLQVAYMAPTEILATQHFESFIQYFRHMPINIGLMTGSGCKKFPSKVNPAGATDISRSQILKWVANGEIAILIGTHSLIQKTVNFKNLAFIVIDEQHRFGTKQRQKLRNKDDYAPHLLSMTATPIPRTLALTIYGDLDLTLLDQMPSGRKPIITEIVLPDGRDAVYEKIRSELEAGRQAYIICPRINEPDPDKESAVIAKSVTEEAKRLKSKVFQKYIFGVLHSKMTPDAKEKIMREFYAHKIDILVATSVVEVGVNVPNATLIVIEGAERFGLAQLHQLRGRVIRGNHQAYCFAFAETKSAKTVDRLKAFKTAKNGFELAEYDLKLRGPGELGGGSQWGVSDIGMEAIKNIKMVEAARKEATLLITSDPLLETKPTLKLLLEEKKKNFHEE